MSQEQEEALSEADLPPIYWEGWISASLMVVLCAIILLQICGRFGIFPGLVWTEELTRWIWVWAAMLGFAATEAHGQHLRMEMLSDMWSKPVRKFAEKVQLLVGISTLLFLVWLGYKVVLRTWHNEAVTLPVTDAVLYAALPIALLLWARRMAYKLFPRKT